MKGVRYFYKILIKQIYNNQWRYRIRSYRMIKIGFLYFIRTIRISWFYDMFNLPRLDYY